METVRGAVRNCVFECDYYYYYYYYINRRMSKINKRIKNR